LGDIGAKAIAVALQSAGNSKLRELRLGDNSIGNAGAEALAQVLRLPECRLRRLSLRNNDIGDVGGRAIALALTSNAVLEEVDLWGNCLSDDCKRAILSVARCTVFVELDLPCRSPSQLAEGHLSNRMHRILFDWISQVHIGVWAPAAFEGTPDPQDMMFRALAHMDAYILCGGVADRSELQLSGVACTLIAAGLCRGDAFDREEVAAWLAFVTDGACTTDQVLDTADRIREVLGFRLHRPTAYTFLRRYLRWTGWSEESFSLANYLIEIAVTTGLACVFSPQAVAAAAAVLSHQYSAQGVVVPHMPRWKNKLLRCARLDVERELAPCTSELAQLHANLYSGATQFVNQKYTWSRFHGVARIVPNLPFNAQFYARYLEAEWMP